LSDIDQMLKFGSYVTSGTAGGRCCAWRDIAASSRDRTNIAEKVKLEELGLV
jgi:hypothetical protein